MTSRMLFVVRHHFSSFRFGADAILLPEKSQMATMSRASRIERRKLRTRMGQPASRNRFEISASSKPVM